MARPPDKPGTWRVKQHGGEYVLSGVDQNGKRIKLTKSSRLEAESLGTTIFAKPVAASGTIIFPPVDIGPSHQPTQLDDFGLPITLRVSPETVASVQQSFGIGGPGQPSVGPTNPVPTPKEVEEKKVKRAKQAKSLMELAGISFAAGDVWLARKVCDRAGKEPVNPNPRQVNDLAEVTKETLAEWFGDREVKPWQMMFLLAIGIPISMLIQSPKRTKEAEAKLKSVP